MHTNVHRKFLKINATNAEQKLWYHLRNRQLGVKFRRQQAIGPYIVDFYCAEKSLIIELDGGQHTLEIDQKRTGYFIDNGARVIRFWNHDVLQNIGGVLIKIQEEIS